MQTFSAPTESTAPRRCGGRFLRSRRTLRTCHCHCLPKAPLRRASSPRTVTAPFVSRCLDSLTRCPTALRKARMQAALRGIGKRTDACSPPSRSPAPTSQGQASPSEPRHWDVLQGRGFWLLRAPGSLRRLPGVRAALSRAKGKGDKCRSFKVKGSAGMMEKQPVLSAKDWRPS